MTGDKEQPRVPFPALPSAHPPNELGASNGSPCMGSDPFNGSIQPILREGTVCIHQITVLYANKTHISSNKHFCLLASRLAILMSRNTAGFSTLFFSKYNFIN